MRGAASVDVRGRIPDMLMLGPYRWAAGTSPIRASSDGSVLWDFTSGDQCYGGAAVSNGVIYWGSGYSLGGSEIDSDQALYAFAVK